MAASLVIEYEQGVTQGWTHPHNGYWAGDFAYPGSDVAGELGTAPKAGVSARASEIAFAKAPAASHWFTH